MLYCVETEQGMLEVSKGVYLTILKRKCSTIKTLTKHKPINSHWNSKKTVKKLKIKTLERNLQKKSKN